MKNFFTKAIRKILTDFKLHDHFFVAVAQKWAKKLAYAFWRDKYHVFVEVFLLVFIVSYFFIEKPFKAKKPKELSEQEKEKLIEEWVPEPLIKKSPRFDDIVPPLFLESAVSTVVTIEEKKYSNFASPDFLNIANRPELKETACRIVRKYAVGSCGPRGFYGSTDVHLSLEKKISALYGSKNCVIYSDTIGCVSSVIAAFSKKRDIILCDSACNFFIKHGVKISHSESFFYEHNNMQSLEKLMIAVKKQDETTKRPLTRRFIVAEGVFRDRADILDLRKLLELKRKYHYRLILDDSFAVGVLGLRGSLDYLKIPLSEIEIYCSSLNFAFGSVCSFCVGDEDVSNYQRLGSAGYCFSASAPPFTAGASSTAIDIVTIEQWRINKLNQITKYFWSKINSLKSNLELHKFEILGEHPVPFCHLRQKNGGKEENENFLMLAKIVKSLRNFGILVEFSRPNCIDGYPSKRGSIRINVNCEHSVEQIDFLANSIKKILNTF
ncbi:hypothetical protein MHBO_001322 [Bonamia ostreae]|uniref:serine C-palmitoyltransferase n=1 Tax=Bonamia ostreae TaxID=126728 RepID=A0ABV2AIK2_9EUKA